MRTKDDEKKEALFHATVKLVNEMGFVSSSVSKIAKRAGVSPSTIYVYYKNKEDLLVSTYIDIKMEMGETLLHDFDDSRPIRDTLKTFWINAFDYISNNLDDYRFCEQFANSPYSDLVDRAAIERHFASFITVIERGVEQKIIKDVNRDFLAAFLFQPISYLANPHKCQGFVVTEEDIETAFTMAWDAIKF